MATSAALQPFAGVAGHDGVLSSDEGEIVVKPCTQAEVAFYQNSLIEHPDFAIHMPTFMGTLSLGTSDQVKQAADSAAMAEASRGNQQTVGLKQPAKTAIVLENLEHGFKHPNVIDIKLGAKLYAPGTKEDKAARLDKVMSETTSGTLNFRIAGMRTWNDRSGAFDHYDKQYGRQFNEQTVSNGFKAFFATLRCPESRRDVGDQIIAAMLSDIVSVREILSRNESRFYGASILIVYEGEWETLHPEAMAMSTQPSPVVDGRAAAVPEATEPDQDDSDVEDEETDVLYRLKMIDFAHSLWSSGQGPDHNVIKGLENIERQLQNLLTSTE